MNYRLVFRYIGYIILLEGLFMIPAMLISLFCRERAARAQYFDAERLSGRGILEFPACFVYDKP